MMSPASAAAAKATAAGGAALPPPPRYANTLDCARTLLKARGIMAMGQGLSATIARNVIGTESRCGGWVVDVQLRSLRL